MIDKSNVVHNIKTGSDTDLYLAEIVTDNNENLGKIKSQEGTDSFPYLTRTTGNSLKPTTEYIQSNELRHGGAESAPRPGNTSVDGSIDFELSPTTFDNNLCALFNSRWEKWESDNDSASNIDKEPCQTGEFLTMATDVNEEDYNVEGTVGKRQLINDGTNNGLLKVPAGCVVHELNFGNKKIEYNVLKKYGGVENEDLYHNFDRLAVSAIDLSAQIGQIVTGSFTLMGDKSSDIMTEDETRAHFGGEDNDKFVDPNVTGNSYVDNLPLKSTDTDQFTTREGDLWINGKNITFAQALTFNIDKNMERKYALFVKNPIDKKSQKKAITANLDTYLVPDSKTLYNLANKNKTLEILFAFEDKEVNPDFTYLFQIFNAKSEDKDLSASGESDYTMSIPLRSFGEKMVRVFRVALPKPKNVTFTPDSTWKNPGTITVIPNAPITGVDKLTGKITVKGTLKDVSGNTLGTAYTLTEVNNTSGPIKVLDNGLIEVTETSFAYSGSDEAYREIEVTINGETITRTFNKTESVAPNPVTNVITLVKAKKATLSWTDSTSEDFDHVIYDLQDVEGHSIKSGVVQKGVQTCEVDNLSSGATYIIDLIAVDENGNKSTVVRKNFNYDNEAVSGLNAVYDNTTSGSEITTVSWTDASDTDRSIHVLVYKADGTLVDSATVADAKTTTSKVFSGALEAGNYTAKAYIYTTESSVDSCGPVATKTFTV